MPTTYALSGTLTSCTAARTVAMTVSITDNYISLLCDSTFATQTNAAQTWTYAPTISSVTPYNVNPTRDLYFPVLLETNTGDAMGYLKITTAGVISFKTPNLPVSGTAGIYGFNVTYDYL
jgi:hypothetical protein